MLHSLGSRLLLLLVALVGAALVASTYAALRAANANVAALLEDELTVRSQVAAFALNQRAETLLRRVDVVTEDFGFRAAVATGEQGTILSALANHGERLSADLALLLSPSGEVSLASAQITQLPRSIEERLDTAAPQSFKMLEVLADKPYLLGISPVMSPDLSGWLVIGEIQDASALADLKQLTGAEVTLLAGTGDQDSPVYTTIAELPNSDPARSGADAIVDQLGTQGWLSHAVALESLNPGETLAAFVSLSLRDALKNYDPLRRQLVIIAFAALLLAALVAALASRWVTRPIRSMVRSAKRIADGDYTHEVNVETGTELDTLGEALSFMQQTVSEREARIQHQAQHDLLTQLPNRNYMFSFYQRFLHENPHRANFGLALIDVENLQQLRDLYGSDFSDEVLRETARLVSGGLRRGDMAGRVGDQQILVFLQGLDTDGLESVNDKIEKLRQSSLTVDGVPVRPELRLGFAFSPAHGSDFDDLERRAQLALADARSAGVAYRVYTVGQDERHLRQIRIANRLESAIRENAFHLLYQPKYRLSDRRVIGAEALIRWEDRELGRVFPDEFIAVAEQTGVITRLSAWVVSRAIRDQLRWRADGITLQISINLSGIDVLHRGFIRSLLDDVQSAGLPMEAIVLEVTETAMMADLDAARSNMELVESMGMRISIDDYGTGFSSLAQLRSLPVRELKLDKSLVDGIEDELGDRLIVRSTIEMAHLLGLEVVAEGIETTGTLTLLHAMGCDTVQGYLLAKPMTANALAEFLDNVENNTAEIRRALEGVDVAEARRGSL